MNIKKDIGPVKYDQNYMNVILYSTLRQWKFILILIVFIFITCVSFIKTKYEANLYFLSQKIIDTDSSNLSKIYLESTEFTMEQFALKFSDNSVNFPECKDQYLKSIPNQNLNWAIKKGDDQIINIKYITDTPDGATNCLESIFLFIKSQQQTKIISHIESIDSELRLIDQEYLKLRRILNELQSNEIFELNQTIRYMVTRKNQLNKAILYAKQNITRQLYSIKVQAIPKNWFKLILASILSGSFFGILFIVRKEFFSYVKNELHNLSINYKKYN